MKYFISDSKGKGNTYAILFAFLLSLFFCLITSCSKKQPTEAVPSKILVLDNCDGGNTAATITQGDNVLILDPNCRLLKKITGFKVKDGSSKQKAISASEDGRYFSVCEDAVNRLSIYETSTGGEYKSIIWPGRKENSAIFFKDKIYAINQTGTLAIDFKKGSYKEVNTFWYGPCYDFVFDSKHNCVWIVGQTITKYSMDFKTLFEVNSVFDISKALAFSVDITSDGSIWIAVKEIYEQNGPGNKLVKISLDGNIIETIPLEAAPACICVDKSDNSIWVTGMASNKDYMKIDDEWPETLSELHQAIETDIKTFTHKYNSVGRLIAELDKGGYSICIDSSDKSVWIGSYDSIIHCSGSGDIIGEYDDVSKRQKWITIVK